MSTRPTFAYTLALAGLAASACAEPTRYHWTRLTLEEGTGAVTAIVAGRDGSIVGVTDGPLIAFAGNGFELLEPARPGPGSPASGPVRIDDQGTIYSHVWRLPRGADAWENIDIPAAPIPARETPIAASDGGLYAYGQSGDTGRIYHRAPDATTWTPVGPPSFPLRSDGPLVMFADTRGAVWIEGEQRLYVGRGEDLHFVLSSDGLDGVLADGTLVYGEDNYNENFGEVVLRTERGEETVRSLGYECTQVNDEPCPTGSLGGVAGFISGTQVAASGDVYSMWAEQNGDWPILMRQPADSDGWEPVWNATDPYSMSAGLVIFCVAANRQVWALTNDQIGIIDPETGSYINTLTAATWRLDPG